MTIAFAGTAVAEKRTTDKPEDRIKCVKKCTTKYKKSCKTLPVLKKLCSTKKKKVGKKCSRYFEKHHECNASGNCKTELKLYRECRPKWKKYKKCRSHLLLKKNAP